MTVADVNTVPFLDLRPVTDTVRGDVLARWSEILDSSSFINGEPVRRFEKRLAASCRATHGIGTANGTDALHLTLRALGIGTGDEVIVPANTFVATAEAVVLAGARPSFADVDPRTLLLTPETIEAAMTPSTRAVVIVHLYGQMADLDAIRATADRHGLLLVEDAAQALDARWDGRPAGSFGIAGCFSFYPGKNLGAFGDAGAVVTSNDALAARIRAMRDHGRAEDSHHDHVLVGFNSRLDTLQAAVLDAKLSYLPEWNAQRRELVQVYRRGIDPQAARLVVELPGSLGVHHLAVVRVRGRDELRQRLAEHGIGTGIHYPTPCHLMVPYAQYATRPLPVTEAAAREIVSLPLYPGMRRGQAEKVAALVNEHAPDGGPW